MYRNVIALCNEHTSTSIQIILFYKSVVVCVYLLSIRYHIVTFVFVCSLSSSTFRFDCLLLALTLVLSLLFAVRHWEMQRYLYRMGMIRHFGLRC